MIDNSFFTHLRVKSEYSMLSSVLKIRTIVEMLKQNNQLSCCLMDDMNLSGSFEFSKEMMKVNMKPILGLNVFIKTENIDENSKFPSIGLIAKNENGYKNLLKILHAGHFNFSKNQYDQHYVDLDVIRNFSSDLICLSGAEEGVVRHFLINNQTKAANEFLQELSKIFSNHFYIELSRHGLIKEKEVNDFLIEYGLKNNIPFVATNDVRFSKAEDFEAYDTLCCIKSNEYLDDIKRTKLNEHFSFKSYQEMSELFSDIPEAIVNTEEIYKRCSYFVKSNQPRLPKLYQENEEDVIKEFIQKGIQKRFLEEKINSAAEQSEYLKRIDFELSVISKMGFCGYFLIVSDFIKFAKEQKIPVGPGRGSGAGSVVAWALEITNVNPIRYGLLFERFLNPERVSMPDFDIDFCQERRREVINYVVNKYSPNRVASIITYGKMQAKAVLKDVGRVMQIPYTRVDEICKLIPFNPLEPITIEKALAMDEKLRLARSQDPEIQRLIDISLQLEGLNRHSSTHAAGIVIANEDIINSAPLYKDTEENIGILGYNMKDAESTGFVKFDFLGLKTLTICQKACEMIKENHGVEIDINSISLDDEKTFELLGSGKLKGIFQLESAVPRQVLYKIKTNKIEDISAITSLNRPGPMENIPLYIRRKLKEEEVSYYYDCLQNELEETYGIIIYQEQVINIARILAGYSLAEADLLRRAMGKKNKEEMDKQKSIFVSRATDKKLITKQDAERMFDIIEKFAGYGFNKSHAVSYSIISYQTAYLKANYTAEFITAMLNINIDNTEQVISFINDAKLFEINVLNPDINTSDTFFQTDGKQIKYALSCIKSIGSQMMSDIISERNTNGIFQNIEDFIVRCRKFLNKRQFENLILTGSFDFLESNRGKLYKNAEKILNFEKKQDVGFFNISSKLELEEYENFTDEEKISKEFEAFGFYLAQNPLFIYSKNISSLNILSSNEIENITQNGNFLMIGVIVKIVQRFKKNGRFAFLHLNDFDGIFETFIFNGDLIIEKQDILKEGMTVICKINADFSPETGVRLRVKDIFDLKYASENNLLMKELKDFVGAPIKENKYKHLKSNNKNLKKTEHLNQEVESVASKNKEIKVLYVNQDTLEDAIMQIRNRKNDNEKILVKTEKSELLI